MTNYQCENGRERERQRNGKLVKRGFRITRNGPQGQVLIHFGMHVWCLDFWPAPSGAMLESWTHIRSLSVMSSEHQTGSRNLALDSVLRHHLAAFPASERGLKNGRVILGHTLALQQGAPSRCFLMGTPGLHLHRHLSTYSPLFLAKEWGVDSLLVVTVQQLYSFSILVQNVCCLMGGRRLGFIFPSVSTRLLLQRSS